MRALTYRCYFILAGGAENIFENSLRHGACRGVYHSGTNHRRIEAGCRTLRFSGCGFFFDAQSPQATLRARRSPFRDVQLLSKASASGNAESA
jgi:hypothetical protein